MSDIGGPDFWTVGEQQPTTEIRVKRPRSRAQVTLAVLAAVFLLAAIGAGLLAVKQNSTAGQWRSRDRTEVVRDQGLSKDLTAANASIASLNANVSTLNGRVGRLRAQLSAVANAKEKALDENAVLTQLNGEADTVSEQLATCVDDMQSLLGEISTDLSTGDYDDPELQSTADTASGDCSTAQQDNDQLQSTLSGDG